jgi:hypothetical protein
MSVAERCLQNEPVSDRDGNPIYVDTPTGKRAAAYAFDPTGATRALELIGRHLGLFEHRIAVRDDRLSDLRLEELVARVQMSQDGRGGSSPLIERQAKNRNLLPFRRQ